MPENELDLRPLIRTLVARRNFIFGAVVASMLITLGLAFLLPSWFRSATVIMPPEESDLLSNIGLAQRALTKFPAFGILDDYFTPADTYKAILQSRSVQETIVDRFELSRVYGIKSREKTLKALQGHSKVKLNPDGTIQMAVEDRDPRRAAAIANAYIEELDHFNTTRRNSRGKMTRRFLEQRVAVVDSVLKSGESRLRIFQERNSSVVPSGAEASEARSAADVMARKLMLEVRLGILRGYLRPEHEQIRQVQSELNSLSGRITQLPALQNDLVRLYRDNKIQEQLLLLLTAELEQARIEEALNTPTVSVLDPAIPPERHARPRRLMLSLGAGALAFLFSSAWFVARDQGVPPA